MWLKRAGVFLALAVAAYAGARWQAAQSVVRDAAASLSPASSISDPARMQEALAQERLGDMARRVGELQGRLWVVEALSARVAEKAGLRYTAPELAPAPLLVADAGSVPGDPAPVEAPESPDAGPGGAGQLGRRMDRLARRLGHQEDAYTLLGTALSRQSGQQAGLPTVSPVDYPYLSSSFGWRRNPVSGRRAMHEGLDFAAPRGAAIRAASGGMVVRAGPVPGYGRMVEIDHGNGLRTRYAHASRVLVRAGDIVRQGDMIARVGSTGRSTGTHLHFEIRMADYPLDPALFVRRERGSRPSSDEVRLTLARPGHHAEGQQLR